MKLISGIPLLRRDDGSVQVGLTPFAYVLEGLKPNEEALLGSLTQEQSGSLEQLAKAYRVKPERVEQLIKALEDCRLLSREPLRTGDEERFYAALGSPRGASSLIGRPVEVQGLGRIGARLVQMLHESGAQLTVKDSRPVYTELMGCYPLESLGREREQELKRIFKIGYAPRPVQITVGTFSYFVDSYWAAQARQNGQLALPIVLKNTSVEVGPFFSPHRDICLRCCYLQIIDEEPCWSRFALELINYDDLECENALSWRVAAFVHEQLMKVSAGYESELWGQSWEFSLQTALPLRRAWKHHPECGCAPEPAEKPPVRVQKPRGISIIAGRGDVSVLRTLPSKEPEPETPKRKKSNKKSP